MKTMEKRAVFLTFLCAFFLGVRAEELPPYTDESFARLSVVHGNVYVQRAAELEYEEGIVNMPLAEGDRLGTTEGRVEIRMGRGKFLRLDHETKIDILGLPDREDDLFRIQVWKGNVYFSISNLEREKSVEVHTADTSLYLLEDGLYRIDVRENETEVLVFRGLLEASGETGSILVKEAQRLEAVGGHFPGRPSAFRAVAEDGFDRWSEERDHELRRQLARRYLPEELEDFEAELAAYGDWAYLSPFGYVWIPGGIEPHWRPYWYGRWVWLPLSGWTWLPYEPWGWVTFHFGRWQWDLHLGWYWIPTPGWGPGWVHWYWTEDYLGWAPLSYWNYPGVVIRNVYYGRHTGLHYPPSSRALTVIHKSQLKARDVSKIALKPDAVIRVGDIRLVKEQPRLRPASSRISIRDIRESRMKIRKSSAASPGNSAAGPGNPVFKVTRKGSPGTSGESRVIKERKILERRAGYPSSLLLSPGKKSKASPQKPRSTLGRIYDLLAGGKARVSRSGSSKGTASKRISSRSGSAAKTKKSSAPPPSRPRSTKVKKKKR